MSKSTTEFKERWRLGMTGVVVVVVASVAAQCLCGKQPFAWPAIMGESLSAWLGGTQSERANNAMHTSVLHGAVSCLCNTTHLLLGCGAVERDKERERRYSQGHLLIQTRQVTLFILARRAAMLLRAFGDV